MRRRPAPRRRRIPESLGNSMCGVWPCIIPLVVDALFHTALFVAYRPTAYGFVRLFLSFVFFIYPLHYVADILWSLRPSVCGILSGRIQINRKQYMNTARREVDRSALLPATISIPVYMESNDVIFETIRMSLAAAKRYREFSGKAASVLISDDGLAPMLGGVCSKEKLNSIMPVFVHNPALLSPKERQAAERIWFYREHGIGFVVRPASGRAGLFKKSSNLNYTLRLGKAVAGGKPLAALMQPGGIFEGGYAEGNIITNDIILLLDKDSGVKERIMEAVIPEFAADEKLAYVQCATSAVNLYDNYYSYAIGHQINNLFHNIWPCKALQGFFVPLVGHNVFLRKSLLEKSGLWAENRVSEDFDKAIHFYSIVTCEDDVFANNMVTIPASRALTKYIVPSEIFERCSTLSETGIEELKRFPAIICRENTELKGVTDPNQWAMFAYIKAVRVSGKNVKIVFNPIAPIQQLKLCDKRNAVFFDLNMDCAVTDLNHSAWSVHKVNVFEAFDEAQIPGIPRPM